MVQNVIKGTYTETYDLNTAIGELSMLSIHTPTAISLKRMFKGFFENYSKVKILGCNFKMVCLSQQALTPDLIGLEAGKVDPRDVANPILFKACTGENLNVLLNQIYNRAENIHGQTDNASIDEHVDSREEAIRAYYTMLADDSFRREHPQRGITVMGLKPMVHRIVSTQNFKWSAFAGNASLGSTSDRPIIGVGGGPDTTGSNAGFGGASGSNLPGNNPVNASVFVSNGLTEMPWLDTAFVKGSGETVDYPVEYLATNIPRVYCGVLILPPAILQRLFFRLQIVWHIAFKDFRPAYEIGALNEHSESVLQEALGNYGGLYHNYYHNAVPSNSKDYGSFSASDDVEVEPVVEKVN